MPQFEVTVSYCLWHTEVYKVEVSNDPEELAEFHESPYDICHKGNRTDAYDGDVMNDTWKETVKEINPLDRIVEALNDHPVHMVVCPDPYCHEGTSSTGRKDDGTKWEEGPWGDCDRCDGIGKIPVEAISADPE